MKVPELLRSDRAVAVAIAVTLFAIYAAGACRVIYVGDSGELVTAVHVLGIPHPTGYPLYVLLGKLWTILVPFGSIAFRMSLFSAVCASAACSVLFFTLRRDGCSRTAALLAAGLLGFGPSFWHEANIQRVYALNALLLVLAMNRAFAWYRNRKPLDLIVTMAICGVGASNHTVMALVGVAVAIWAPVVEPALFRRPKVVASCGAAFLTGLLVYAYLPLRSAANPILNWGEPSTPERFFDVVLRRTFWSRAWWESLSDLRPILLDFVASLGPETGYAGLALAIIALSVRPDKRWILPVLVIALNVGALARHGSFYDIFVWHRYYIPAILMTIVLAAWGLEIVRQRVSWRAVPLILLVPVGMLVVGWKANDHSRHRFAYDYSRIVLDSLPPGATLVANDDNVLFVLLYLKYVERLRPDVELVAEGVDQTKLDLFFDPDVDAVFFTHPSSWTAEGLSFAPRGLLLQAIREERPWPEPIPTPPLPGLEDESIPRDFLTRTLVAHYWFMQALTWEVRDWAMAEAAIEEGLSIAPDYPLSLYNFGVILERNGFYDEALRAWKQADRINPRGLVNRSGRVAGATNRIIVSLKIGETEVERARIRELESTLEGSFPPGTSTGSREWHRLMADRLAAQGEAVASRFHALHATPPKR